MNPFMIKGVGIAATVIGAGATFASNWVSDKKMDERIDKKVAKAMSEYEKKKTEKEGE